MWVGTFGGGLFRYDGREVKRYSETTGELIGNNVTALHQDSNGIIWIGTLSGINTYDKRTGDFSSIELFDQSASGFTNGVWAFHASETGAVWIGTNGDGLFKYNPGYGSLKRFAHDERRATSIPSDKVYNISGAGDGRLLLATFGGGFARLDPRTEEVDLHLGFDEGLANLHVLSACEGRHRLWIGTQEGLNRYDPETGKFHWYAFVQGDETSLGGPIVTDVREDRYGDFWVTSFNGDASLSRRDEKTGKFTRFGTRDSAPGELSQRGARTLFEDRSGILWVVSLGGLVKYDKHSVGFSMLSLGSGILPMYEDRHNTMWLGTVSGLRRFSQDSRTSVPVHDEKLSHELVTAFLEDSQGRSWLGIYGGDLVQFDAESESEIRRFRADDAGGIPESDCIRRILEVVGSPGKLWLLTQGGGLALFDPDSGSAQCFRHSQDDSNSLCSDTASYGAIVQEDDGSLWIGTDNGLGYWRPGENRFRHYWTGRSAPGSLQSGVVQALHRDVRNRLWVGTSQEMHRYDETTGRFEHFGIKQGLSDNSILGILESRDRLWLSTPNGVTAFDPTGVVPPQVFRREDGGPGDDSYLLTSFYKTRDNEFWFGGPSGFTHFNPDKLSKNGFVPPVVFTSLAQGGMPLDLNADPACVQSISIRWPMNHFEIQAAALSYSMPQLNRYRYRLEGLDPDWIESRTGNGSYLGIPGGNDLLRVQASNNSGVWNENGAVLGAHVARAVWNTQWFRTVMLLVATSILAGVACYVEILRHEVVKRRTAERRLEVSQMQYRSIVEVRFDVNGFITFANHSYCEANGVMQDDALGRHYSWRIHPEEQFGVEQLVRMASRDNPQRGMESRAYRPDGTIAWESWVGRAIYDSTGLHCGYQAVGRDITLHRMVTQALEEKEAKLNHLNDKAVEEVDLLAGCKRC